MYLLPIITSAIYSKSTAQKVTSFAGETFFVVDMTMMRSASTTEHFETGEINVSLSPVNRKFTISCFTANYCCCWCEHQEHNSPTRLAVLCYIYCICCYVHHRFPRSLCDTRDISRCLLTDRAEAKLPLHQDGFRAGNAPLASSLVNHHPLRSHWNPVEEQSGDDGDGDGGRP